MATRDVLEALAAAAGRQSAIGGLMFQDAQKREAQGYELALQKEKWRRSGEATALKNARGAWKFKAEKHYSQASKFYTSYVNAKRGVGVGGEFDLYGGEAKYSEEDIAEFKRNYEEAIREGNRAMKHFMRYSGIEEEYTPVPIEDLDKIPAGTGTAKPKGKLAEMVNSVLAEHYITKLDDEGKLQSPKNWETMVRQRGEGGEVDANPVIGTINSILVDAYLEKRKKAGYSGAPTDEEKKKAHLTPEQEQDARKMIMERLDEENEWAFLETRADSGYPSRNTAMNIPSPFSRPEEAWSTDLQPQLQSLFLQEQAIEAGAGQDTPNMAAFNEAVASEIQGRLGKPVATNDPSVIMANRVAADRAEEAAAEQAAAEKRQGIISSTEYKRAYSDAQKIITQMAQSGYLSYDAFEKFIAEQSLQGIEMMAYRQAFKDAAAKSGSSRFSIGEDPYSFGGPLDHRSWWENTKRGTRTMLDNFR